MHSSLKPQAIGATGLWVAGAVLVLWGLSLYAGLFLVDVDWANPIVYLLFLVQTHLYTGLFITAHDAMHGLVNPNKKLNDGVGFLAAGLFSYNNYFKLKRKHHQHHAYPATLDDPDYNAGQGDSFWPWYWSFVRQYVSLWQILAMAVSFNLLKLIIPSENLIVFWMAPAILSTFQLFYFGTYRPHGGEHTEQDRHKARSQPMNHLAAFLSCYFFGYHHEHHAMPWLPWYRLPKAREASQAGARGV